MYGTLFPSPDFERSRVHHAQDGRHSQDGQQEGRHTPRRSPSQERAAVNGILVSPTLGRRRSFSTRDSPRASPTLTRRNSEAAFKTNVPPVSPKSRGGRDGPIKRKSIEKDRPAIPQSPRRKSQEKEATQSSQQHARSTRDNATRLCKDNGALPQSPASGQPANTGHNAKSRERRRSLTRDSPRGRSPSPCKADSNPSIHPQPSKPPCLEMTNGASQRAGKDSASQQPDRHSHSMEAETRDQLSALPPHISSTSTTTTASPYTSDDESCMLQRIRKINK